MADNQYVGEIFFGSEGYMIFPDYDPQTERFVNDPEADKYLKRDYREPYVVPEHV